MNCRRSGSSYGVAPVDERQQVRRHAHATSARARSPRCASAMNSSETRPCSAASSLREVGDRVLRLPLVIEELGLADVRVGRDAPPELAAQQLAVRQAGRRHRRLAAPRAAASDAERRPACYRMTWRPFSVPRSSSSPRAASRATAARSPTASRAADRLGRAARGASPVRSGTSSAKPNTDTSSPGAQRRGADQVPALRRARRPCRRRRVDSRKSLAFLDQQPRPSAVVVALLDPPERGAPRRAPGSARAACRAGGPGRRRRAAPRTPRTSVGRDASSAQPPARDARRRPTAGAAAPAASRCRRSPPATPSRRTAASACGREPRAAAPARATARPAPGTSRPSEILRERRRRRTTPRASTGAARTGPRRAESPASRARRAAAAPIERLQARQRDPAGRRAPAARRPPRARRWRDRADRRR